MQSPSVTGLPSRPEKLTFLTRFLATRDTIDAARLKPSYYRATFLVLLLFYLALTAAQASRHLWYDELFTYYIAKSPSLASMWQNIRLDLTPPLVFLAERFALKTFGDNLYAARLPSILGFAVGSFCFGKFVSNRLGLSYGILAVLVVWASPLEYYATEARAYAIIIGFFGIAMLAWQQAIQLHRRIWPVALLAFAISGMMCSHVLALIYAVPFLVAELLRWHENRRFDAPIWASLAIPAISAVIYIPLMMRYQQSVYPFVTQSSPGKFFGFFYRMLGPVSLPLLIALCLALAVGFRKCPWQGQHFPALLSVEWAFTWALILIPALVTVAMMRSHGVAFPRYSAPAVFLFGISFSFLLALYTKTSRTAAIIASATLLFYLAVSNAVVFKSSLQSLKARNTQPPPEAIARVEPNLPLVTASALNFLEMDKYADPATVKRLYYLTDWEFAMRYAHATLFEGLPKMRGKFPVRASIEPYRKFVVDHPHFLVLGEIDYPEQWLLRRLADIHASLQYLGNYPGGQLYLVTMPGRAVPQLAE